MNNRVEFFDNVEKLKLLLLKNNNVSIGKNNKSFDEIWDDLYNFFFMLREECRNRSNLAMENFIRIIWELKSCAEHDELKPIESINDLNISNIEQYLLALKQIECSDFRNEIYLLFDNKNEDGKDTNFLILKTLLSICIRNDRNEKLRNVEMRRAYELIYNKIHRRGYLKHKPLLFLLKNYLMTFNGCFYNIALEVCSYLNDDECFDTFDLKMIKIMLDSVEDNLMEISLTEKEFWRTWSTDNVKCHHIWKGNLSILIEWCLENKAFNIDCFCKYSYFFDSLFAEGNGHEINLLRRAWIVGMNKYVPVGFGSYYTFCWEWEDWETSIKQNSSDFKNFLDSLIEYNKKEKNMNKVMRKYIASWVHKDFIEFAKDSYLINFTNNSDTCDIYYHYGIDDWCICTAGSRKCHTGFISLHNAFILKSFKADYNNNCLENRKMIGEKYGDWGIYYDNSSEDSWIVVECPSCPLNFKLRYDNKQRHLFFYECWKGDICNGYFNRRNGFYINRIRNIVFNLVEGIMPIDSEIELQNYLNRGGRRFSNS